MRYNIRRGDRRRYSLALILFFVSIAVAAGQEAPAAQKTDGVPVVDKTSAANTTNPPTVVDGTPPAPQAEPPKTPQETPAKTTPSAPTTPPTTVAAQPTPVAAQPPAKGKNPPKKGKGANDMSGGSPVATGPQSKPYEIGPEDVLYLSVLHQVDVTGQLNVRPDGFVTVRFAGDIKAAGLTTQQLSDIVTEKLTTYFNHPEVNIQVVQIRSKKYYLSGEVRKPGAYTLSTPKTILEAMIEGGGPAEFGKSKKIYILRGQQRIPFNYNDVSKGKHLEQNILLQNGDIVVVP